LRIAVAPVAICSLFLAAGTGSCALGGFLQGSGFCATSSRGGVMWDPVPDFHAIQGLWSFAFLFSAFFATLSLLALLPGRISGWQRFLFLATAGKRGAWRDMPAPNPIADRAFAAMRERIERETDPALKAHLIASEAAMRAFQRDEAYIGRELRDLRERLRDPFRGLRWMASVGMVVFPFLSIGFLIPAVLGALTQETLVIGRGMGTAALADDPGLFWFNIGASLVLSAVFASLALGVARLRRSNRPPGHSEI
jgi:hypothetical protein